VASKSAVGRVAHEGRVVDEHVQPPEAIRNLSLEALEHLVGPGRVADEVAEGVALIYAGGGNVGEHRLEGGQVGVDIREEGYAHVSRLDPQVT